MRLALLSFLFFACPALAQPDPEVLNLLREGGYVLYLRHTSTDFSQNDSRMTSFEDCASQRNLTDRGRDEARAIGEHVKRLEIPIGEVLASVEMPAGIGVSGLESDGADRFFCGGGNSGKMRVLRRPRQGGAV